MLSTSTAIRRAGAALSLVRHDAPATEKRAAVSQSVVILSVATRGPDECPSCGRVGCFCDKWGGAR